MRLPKWVTRWIKDNFDVEALELKCKQQEEEIARLKRRIEEIRYYSLPEAEREWVERVYSMMEWPMFWRQRSFFVSEYLKQRDDDINREYLRQEWFLPF